MNLRPTGRLFALISFLLLSVVFTARAEDKEWTWMDEDGEIRSRGELEEILRKHMLWVESGGQSGSRASLRDVDLRGVDLRGVDLPGADLHDASLFEANLSGANLSGANLSRADLGDTDLSGANLSFADLHDASLFEANLSGANLSGANLRRAFLRRAFLSDADLREVDLHDARLWEADLRGADLGDADLSGTELVVANLSGANLSGANLRSANLRGAFLGGAKLPFADLRGATYEPKENPPPEYIALARNLALVRYDDNSKPLTDLRRSLKESGFGGAERQVTAALRRHDATLLETVFFDWTCEFGANAVRPLWIVLFVWLICTPIYWLFLHRGKRSGLYLLASGKEVNTGNERLRVRRLRYRPPRRCRWYTYIFRVAAREWHALSTASLFSLMSAFNIGFRELNFGRWIRMLQPREFDIKARGMVRVVSGIQSLLSVGLVALSLLSYFARPFEI